MNLVRIGKVAKKIIIGVSSASVITLLAKVAIDKSRYDENGYDSEGYDRNGFDINGFNRDGYDKHGYDHNGFNAEGYDRLGRDYEGYRRNGFDLDGFNREGYDRQGFNREGYNAQDLDRAGHKREYYVEHMDLLHDRLNKAKQQLQHEQLRYAVYDARTVMDDALRMIVQHAEGTQNQDDKMVVNLKICEKKHLISDSEFLDRLHAVRKICNVNGHEIDSDDSLNHNQAHFVVMQVRDLLNYADQILGIE